MKKALSIVLSLCIAVAILFVAVSCGKTDTEVKGEPKTVYEYYENGNVKTSYDYDAKGNLIKEFYYNPEGKLTYVYEYDENGNVIKRSSYRADGEREVDEYDKDGKITKYSKYDAADKLEFYIVRQYDENGNRTSELYYDADGKLTKDTCYNPEGTIEYYLVYEYYGKKKYESYYNAEGKLAKQSVYDSEGKIESCYVYEYDAKGRKAKESYYNADGKLTKDTCYNPEGTIEYYLVYEYDESGNMAKQSKYDTAGNDISYDENSKYFTYEESKAGYIIITGTTNEAKGMTSLTTPRAYNEKRVLLIARGAFDGCSVLTDIYVTPGISQIGDGAFSGAPSLKKIHILNTDPDKTTVNNVTFGLIDGMVKGAKFYVPKGYAREFSASYFWGPYADYITEE